MYELGSSIDLIGWAVAVFEGGGDGALGGGDGAENDDVGGDIGGGGGAGAAGGAGEA